MMRLAVSRFFCLGLAAVVIAIPANGAAGADRTAKPDTSLQFVPEDVAFYSSLLRGGEQIQAVLQSRAWAKVKTMPIVKMGLALYQMQAASPESVPGKIETALSDPEIRKVLDVLKDMVSREVFVAGGKGFVESIELAQSLQAAGRFGPLFLQLSGQAEGESKQQQQAQLMLATLAEEVELIHVPEVLVGFRLSNTAAAAEQLVQIEKMAIAAADANPHLKGRVKRSAIAGNQYLTLSLDGKMVPWNEIPLDKLREFESEKGDLDKVVGRLKELTLVVALGIRDDYLLLGIGPSTRSIERLGKGKPLAQRAELAPLARFAQKRLTGISYASRELVARVATTQEDVDGLLEAVEELMPLADLNDQQQQRIRKDAKALAADVKQLMPKPGPLFAVSFLSDGMAESYQYNWTQQPRLDGSKPLDVQRHVGGTPVLAWMGRGKILPGDYELVVKWLKIGYGYFEEFGLPRMPDGERPKVQQFLNQLRPLAERLDRANRTMLIPALADGQTALVLDTELRSKQFIAALPATREPMPMLEPALVFGVSDAALLRKACAEYRAVAEGVLEALRRVEPDSVPAALKIPKAQVTPSPFGPISGYPLPEPWGVDPAIAPNGAVSESVAVLSLSRQHTERLLKPTPLAASLAPAGADQPSAAIVAFDWAALVDAFRPWVDLLIEKQFGDDAGTKQQVHTAMDVLKVLRTITARSYIEGGALVTHMRTEIRDVAE